MNKDRFNSLQFQLDDRLHWPDPVIRTVMQRDGSFYIVEQQSLPKVLDFDNHDKVAPVTSPPYALVTTRLLHKYGEGKTAMTFSVEGICIRAILLNQDRNPTSETVPELEGCRIYAGSNALRERLVRRLRRMFGRWVD
jgi:hypothetical protein